jgi:hypothetical protein
MDDYRDADPASWPYGNDAPPAQVQLQRQRAASGPQLRVVTGGQRALPAAPAPRASGPQQAAPQDGTAPQASFMPRRQPRRFTPSGEQRMPHMPSGAFTADPAAVRRVLRALRGLSVHSLGTARNAGVPYADKAESPVGDHLAARWTPPLGPARSSAEHLRRRLRALQYPKTDGSAGAAAAADLMSWVDVITGTRTPPLSAPPLHRAQYAIARVPEEGTLRAELLRRTWEAVHWYSFASSADDADDKAQAYAELYDAVKRSKSDAEGRLTVLKALADPRSPAEPGDIAPAGSYLEGLLSVTAGGAR